MMGARLVRRGYGDDSKCGGKNGAIESDGGGEAVKTNVMSEENGALARICHLGRKNNST